MSGSLGTSGCPYPVGSTVRWSWRPWVPPGMRVGREPTERAASMPDWRESQQQAACSMQDHSAPASLVDRLVGLLTTPPLRGSQSAKPIGGGRTGVAKPHRTSGGLLPSAFGRTPLPSLARMATAFGSYSTSNRLRMMVPPVGGALLHPRDSPLRGENKQRRWPCRLAANPSDTCETSPSVGSHPRSLGNPSNSRRSSSGRWNQRSRSKSSVSSGRGNSSGAVSSARRICSASAR